MVSTTTHDPAPPIWRRARPGVAAAIVGAGVVGAFARRHELGTAWRLVEHARWGWLLVAVCFEVASMILFARLQRTLLRSGGVSVPDKDLAEITLAANAVAVSVPGGAVFSARWSYGQLRQRGAEPVLAGWTVLVAGALASFALFVILAAGAWIAGGRGPVASLRGLALGLALIPVAVFAAAALIRRVSWVRRSIDAAIAGLDRHPHGHGVVQRGRLFSERLRTARPTPVGWLHAFGLASANWMANLACLVATIAAVRGHVPWRGILVAYGLAQVAAVLPLTPGGLAVVEGSLAALLVAYGMTAPAAVAATLLYRVIGFWALVPIGWTFYAALARRSLAGPAPPATGASADDRLDVGPATGVPRRRVNVGPATGVPRRRVNVGPATGASARDRLDLAPAPPATAGSAPPTAASGAGG